VSSLGSEQSWDHKRRPVVMDPGLRRRREREA